MWAICGGNFECPSKCNWKQTKLARGRQKLNWTKPWHNTEFLDTGPISGPDQDWTFPTAGQMVMRPHKPGAGFYFYLNKSSYNTSTSPEMLFL